MRNTSCFRQGWRAAASILLLTWSCIAPGAPAITGLNPFGGVTGYNTVTGAQVAGWSGGLSSNGSIALRAAAIPLSGTLALGMLGLMGLMIARPRGSDGPVELNVLAPSVN